MKKTLMILGFLAMSATIASASGNKIDGYFDRALYYSFTLTPSIRSADNSGTLGNAFNLVNGGVSFGNDTNPFTATNTTLISFTMNMSDEPKDQVLFNTGGNGNLSVCYTKEGNIKINRAGQESVITSSTIYNAGVNISLSLLCQNGTYTLYMDGVQALTITPGDKLENPFANNLWIGSENTSGGVPLLGSSSITDFQVNSITKMESTLGVALTGEDLAKSIMNTGSLVAAYSIPEPSTATLGLLGLGALLLRRRRTV